MAVRPKTKQNARRGAPAAVRLVGKDVTPLDYLVGRAPARLTAEVAMIIITFFVGNGILISMGWVFQPGYIALYLVFNAICPVRGVLVAEQGVAVLSCSIWALRPHKVLYQAGHPAFPVNQVSLSSTRARVPLLPEPIDLSRKEFERMMAALVTAKTNARARAAMNSQSEFPSGAISFPGMAPPNASHTGSAAQLPSY